MIEPSLALHRNRSTFVKGNILSRRYSCGLNFLSEERSYFEILSKSRYFQFPVSFLTLSLFTIEKARAQNWLKGCALKRIPAVMIAVSAC